MLFCKGKGRFRLATASKKEDFAPRQFWQNIIKTIVYKMFHLWLRG
jgi:hypothetical protein